MSMRKVILSSATLAIALWLAPGAGAADPIKIGIVGPNTGPAATTRAAAVVPAAGAGADCHEGHIELRYGHRGGSC